MASSISTPTLLSSAFRIHLATREHTVILEENAVLWKYDSVQIGKVL